jgi:hypothetical protein
MGIEDVLREGRPAPGSAADKDEPFTSRRTGRKRLDRWGTTDQFLDQVGQSGAQESFRQMLAELQHVSLTNLSAAATRRGISASEHLLLTLTFESRIRTQASLATLRT